MPAFLKRFQNSKTRNIVIITIVLLVSITLFGIYWASSGSQTTGPTTAKVPSSPSGIRFEPESGQLSPEYLKALLATNQQAAEEALQRGTSSIPPVVRTPDQGQGTEAALTEKELGPCLQQCTECCRGARGSTELLNAWVKQGKMSPEAAQEISRLQDQQASVEDYANSLNRLVREGKLTPEQAKQLLAAYRLEHEKKVAAVPSTDVLLTDMVGTGKLDPAVSGQLRALKGQSKEDYAAALNQLVKSGKLTADQAKQLLSAYEQEGVAAVVQPVAPLPMKTDYQTVLNDLKNSGAISPEVAGELESLRQANAPAFDYAKKLNDLVKAGKLSPQMAAKLLEAYKQTYGETHAYSTEPKVAAMQRNQQMSMLKEQEDLLSKQKQKEDQMQQQQTQAAALKQMQDASAAISGQAQSLIAAWNPVIQSMTVGAAAKEGRPGAAGQSSTAGTTQGAAKESSQRYPLVKAGTIMFAVLDTGLNSDQPGPVMATIVSGRFKGARLLGSLTPTSDNERVMLRFTMLSMPEWPDTISIDAVAINPDTAHTALASNVDHHYLLRYGSLFAANFISGYADAIKTSGSSQTTETSGEKVSNYPKLSPKEKIAAAFGAVGTQLNTVLSDLYTRKPTVTVDSGVGLGILFLNGVYTTFK